MAHETVDHRQSVALHGSLDLGNTSCVRSQLCLQVCDVLVGIARGEACCEKRVTQLTLTKRAADDQWKTFKENAFLFNCAAEWWHGAGSRTADIRVMRARCDKEVRIRGTAEEYRRYDRHIRQVSATVVGAIQQPRVAWPHVRALSVNDRTHARAH